MFNIGVDIDGVLTNDDDYFLDYSTKYCVLNDLELFENPYGYENRKYNWTREIKDKYNSVYLWEYATNEPPRRFASEVLNKLKNDGNKIFIITSRRFSTRDDADGQKMRDIVKDWLKKYNIPYNDIYFSRDKVEQLKDLKIDIMIEDSPLKIPEYVNYSHILCYDCRYNKDLDLPNMTRVFSWYDIYDKIKKYRGQK